MHWKAAIRLRYSSHLAAGTWGVTEMLASFEPGMDLADAERCSSSISVEGGAAHTAQAADGLTQSQPATAPQSQRKLWARKTKSMLTCAYMWK